VLLAVRDLARFYCVIVERHMRALSTHPLPTMGPWHRRADGLSLLMVATHTHTPYITNMT
jgi:hypothetical protein